MWYNRPVKLTVGIKLMPTKEQTVALRETLQRANEAANEISRLAWESKTFGQFKLHRLVYKAIREQFGLSAQVVVRLIAKVADAYKLDKHKQRVFRKDGAIAFDDRILKYNREDVSIWTLNGRQKIPFVAGAQQKRLLHSRQGESDLVLREGKWFLFAICNVIEPATDDDPEGMLGVDFGIVRVATDSDGQSFSGAHIKNLRARHRKLRAKLQSKGSKSAKRLLRKRRRKESNFAKDLNHQISKAIVKKAKDTNRGIAIEELTGINARTTVRKVNRAERLSWAFADLRTKIEYKAKLAGVRIVVVDPRNTSRTCSACGFVHKSNRRSQSVFQCQQCGHRRNADTNAARNISSRAMSISQTRSKSSLDSEPQAACFSGR